MDLINRVGAGISVFLAFMMFSPLHADDIERYFSIASEVKKSSPEFSVAQKIKFRNYEHIGNCVVIELEIKNNGKEIIPINYKDFKIKFSGVDSNDPAGSFLKDFYIERENDPHEKFPVNLKNGGILKVKSYVFSKSCDRFTLEIDILDRFSEKLEFKPDKGKNVMLGVDLKDGTDIKTFVFNHMIQSQLSLSNKAGVLKVVIMRETDFDKIKDRLANDRIILESENSFIPVGGPHDPKDRQTSASKGYKEWPENHDKMRKIEQLKTAAALRIKNFKLPDNGELKVYVGEFRGILAASGSTYYFTKKNGKWQFVRHEQNWLS